MYKEMELTQPVSLCDDEGCLRPDSVGWSRRPLHTCNVRGHWPRKKKWNYWCVTSDKYLFSVTLSNIDYMGLAFAYFLNFETKAFVEQTVMVPLGRGCDLPPTVDANVSFTSKSMSLSLTEENGGTRIRVDSPAFGDGTLRADLFVQRPPGHQTTNVVIPWSADRFQFTSKQNALPASGAVTLGSNTFLFDSGRSFGCLDYGRGVWRYSCFWNWASCSGFSDGRTIGVNLGTGWTEGTGLTEDSLCVDGRISKLNEPLTFAYDPGNFLAPWTLRTTTSPRVDLLFTPFFERVAKTDLLVLRSEVHQMIGRFSGRVVTDEGESVDLVDLVGWAEEHRARW